MPLVAVPVRPPRSANGPAHASPASPTTTASDTALVEASREGDLAAFDELVRRHQAMLGRCLYRFCPHRSDLEDLVQDTFIKAFRNLAQWKPTAPFENWLRRIAYNTGYEYFRTSNRNPVALGASLGEAAESVLGNLPATGDARLKFQHSEQIHWLLENLPADERSLLTLHYLEGLSLAEIAGELGWSLAQTKTKNHRAKKKLRAVLDRHGITGF